MKYLFALLSMLITLTASANPAKRVTKTLTLADGTTVEATLHGDEHGHWYVAADGSKYALNAKEQAFRLSDSEFQHRLNARSERFEAANDMRAARMQRAVRRNAFGGTKTEYIGQKRGLVILVNFTDKRMNSTHTKSFYDKRFNEQGYTDSYGAIGSVRDYFLDQSYQQLDINFDIVGPVTLSNNMAYYGGNDYSGNDKHPCEMVCEAIALADASVNFADYDWNGDGTVDQVYVIYAGYGESQGASSNTIWPHEWALSAGKRSGDGSGAQFLDGVTIDTYAVSCELSGYTGSVIDGIGTAVHEFSHCLGYPDMYDYNGATTPLNWDVLDMGSYNGPESRGEVPAAYTSYERMTAGWISPIVLDKPCRVKDMPALNDEPVAYIIYNDAHQDEYYMLENRQQKRWDTYTGGHGMMIFHIDYDANAWAKNTVNADKNRPRMMFIAADNHYGSYQYGYGYEESESQRAGDPFPGTSNNTALTDHTTPAAKLFNQAPDGRYFLGKPIERIAEKDGKISFEFMGGFNLDAPVATDATDVTAEGFTANWNSVENAVKYSLEVIPVAETKSLEESLLITEDCGKFTGTASGGDQTTDINKLLDDYTKTPGWTGAKVYSGPNRIKLGSSNSVGNITTPELTTETNDVTVKVKLASYSTDAKKTMYIHAITEQETKTIAVDMVADPTDYVIVFNGVMGDFNIKIETEKRGYVYGIEVYDGDFSEELGAQKVRSAAAPTSAVFNDLTECSYVFTDIQASKYKYHVKAVDAEGNESKWSDFVFVVVPEPSPDAINSVSADGAQVNVYDIMGRRVSSKGIGALAHGLYIINGKKVMK